MKLLSASFFTTVSFRQALTAFNLLLPWNWPRLRQGAAVAGLENDFRQMFGVHYAKAFYNARGALYHGLTALNLPVEAEIIVQAYTCVSVPNAIIAAGLKPVYADIGDDFNIYPEGLEKLITAKTKAVIVQHTFGSPADLNAISAIAARHQLKLIEDCAHSLGAQYQGRLAGTFGEFSVFSFGRDKVISSVNGGMLITNNQEIYNKLSPELQQVGLSETLKNLFYPILAFKSRFWYNFFNLGKVIIFAAKKLRLIPLITSIKENNCDDRRILSYAMPNCLAVLARQEIKRLFLVNSHRQQIAQMYLIELHQDKLKAVKQVNQGLYLRFVCLVENRDGLYRFLKKHGVIAGNWYDAPIAPSTTGLSSAGYVLGSCPTAEKFAEQTLNLPNHEGVSFKDAKKIINLINQWQRLN